MKSNNPVFARSEEFNRASSNSYGNQTYAAGGSSYPGYGDAGTDPSTWGTGTPGHGRPGPDDGRLGRPEDSHLGRPRLRRRVRHLVVDR